jgi:hypothetical protein
MREKGFQVWHVPDAALTGKAFPPGSWLDMPGTSNNVAGGGLSLRIGQTEEVITVDCQRPEDERTLCHDL